MLLSNTYETRFIEVGFLKHQLNSHDPQYSQHQGKRVLVTGAAGEIGIALVQEFRRQGLQVFATDIKPKPARLEVERYAELDLQKLVSSDVPAQRNEPLSEILAWTGESGLDVVVNNAAIQLLGPLEKLDIHSWQASLNVNLLAPFFLIKTLLADLERARGSVVNISSIHARLTKPSFVAYATTKSALSGMTRALAVELGSRIRVNAVEPASIDTSMLRASFEGKEEQFEGLAQCHPQGRVGTPEEIASLVFAISLGDFSFLHGACIDMSGGISARLHDAI